ncbi:hypothetical protein C8Q77DRAFT_1046508, partial [Trametes polyzona]
MLSPTVAKSWWQLERSLLRVCDILLEAASGSREAKFPFDPFWPNPSEYSYRDPFPTMSAARVAALKARDACAILAAWCTMAIALLTTGVPPAWIDEFRASALADLSPGLRVGAIIYPVAERGHESATAWVDHVPCMIRANLPVYIAWPEGDLYHFFDRYPFLLPYAPDFTNVPEVPSGAEGHVVMHPRPRMVGMQSSF